MDIQRLSEIFHIMLQPKRSKFRKSFRGRRKGLDIRGSSLAFGEFGLKSIDRAWLAANQIEAARKTVTNALKRKGRLWIRVFPDKPVTERAAGQRMGQGKGDVDRHVAVIRPGRILLEIAGIPEVQARDAFAKAAAKLPVRTKFTKREE